MQAQWTTERLYDLQIPESIRRWATLFSYYVFLVALTILGVVYGYFFAQTVGLAPRPQWLVNVLNVLKLSWLMFLPYALLNFYSFLRYPVVNRRDPPLTRRPLGVRLYFRFVTRGMNPSVIAESVEHARRAIEATLRPDEWVIEVVTDRPVQLDSAKGRVGVIVVPREHLYPSDTKYKARALQYALGASTARPTDWVVHLDEETRFNLDTVRAIHDFVAQERQALATGERTRTRIGQGVVIYGARGVVNWLCTLADSIRVGDDYGRFRLQYLHGKAYFGMHGSFIVINNAIEMAIGFDYGLEASITEDAYFALMAQSAGFEFAFIDAFMFEKSPFSLPDFVRQRHRWFGGLWLCARTRRVPFKERAILAAFMVIWSVSWVSVFMLYVNMLIPTRTPLWLAIPGGLSFAFYVALYLVGFFRTFEFELSGRYVLTLLAQIVLIPLYSIMEALGILYGLTSPCRNFYIVQKEVPAA